MESFQEQEQEQEQGHRRLEVQLEVSMGEKGGLLRRGIAAWLVHGTLVLSYWGLSNIQPWGLT
jgi:hypothetical protein